MQIKRLRYLKIDIYTWISIVMMWFAAFASLYSDVANKIGLYIALPLAFVFASLKNRGFHFNIYEKILYSLYAWDCISYLWADDKDMASFELHTILGGFLLTYVISILAREKKNILYLYIIFLLLYLSAWNYALHHIMASMVNADDRLNDEHLNANTLAYYTFYVSFLALILNETNKHTISKKIWILLFWIMLPISFATSILTASRQILIVQIPLYIALIYIKYIKSVSTKHKIRFAIIALICLIAISTQVTSIYNNSYLKQRSEVSVSDDPRADLAREAIEKGIANLPVGLGAGNFQSVSQTRQISHNSYTESFVNMGLPGIALYSSLLGVFMWRQLKRYIKYKDNMFLVFFVFGALYTLDGVFFVFYNGPWLISFLMLVAAHSEIYAKEIPNLNTTRIK